MVRSIRAAIAASFLLAAGHLAPESPARAACDQVLAGGRVVDGTAALAGERSKRPLAAAPARPDAT